MDCLLYTSVVSVVDGCLFVVDFYDLRCNPINEIAVMADHDHTTRIRGQERLEP